MNFVAIKMLTGDRAKYLGLIFAIAFAAFLLENQSSIFAGVMLRTASQIVDVTDADISVMDRNTQYIDGIRALTEALARYEQTVLGALQETEDALVAYGEEHPRLQRLAEAVDAS